MNLYQKSNGIRPVHSKLNEEIILHNFERTRTLKWSDNIFTKDARTTVSYNQSKLLIELYDCIINNCFAQMLIQYSQNKS